MKQNYIETTRKEPDPHLLVSHYEKLNSKLQVSNDKHKLLETNLHKLEMQTQGIPELEKAFHYQ